MRTTDRTIAIAGCGVALGTLAAVALFQSGALDRLPDPPGEVFDSKRITESQDAHPLGIPDSYLGLGSYGVTLALVLVAERHLWARRALGAKLVADAGLAGFNTVRQVVRFGKVCSWCMGTVFATAATVYGGRKAIASTVRWVRRAT